MTSAAQTRVSLAALAATLLVALTIVPLIQGLGWYVATFVVLALSSGTGLALRQLVRYSPVAVAGQIVVAALALTALFAGDSAQWGLLPGPEALGTIRDLLAGGLQVTRQDAPPVEATRGLVLLATGGVSIIGVTVDIIAASLRRPAAGGLPLLAVYCVPIAVLPDGLNWPYFILAGAGFLLLVGADAADRVRGWGRVLGTSPASVLEPEAPLYGARRVSAACLAVAVLVPAFVPGLGQRLVGSDSAFGTGPGSGPTIRVVNPILNVGKDLGSNSNETVIQYTTDEQSPAPLRIATDDTFNGTTWAPPSSEISRKHRVADGHPLPSPPGLSRAVPRRQHTMTIDVGQLAQTYLPLPYPTTEVQGLQGEWLWENDTLNVVGDGITTKDLSYTAHYLTVQPTSAQLRNAGPPPRAVLEPYTKLPAGMPASIKNEAVKEAGKGTNYDKAVRLQSWFRSDGGFTYSTTLSRDGSGKDAVEAFLASRKGYCVQFASTMAVMARTLGIPARVAVGFLPGKRGNDDTYTITPKEAHAWPELYFEGIGWVRFEPTPSGRSGMAPPWTVQQQTAPPQTQPSTAAPAPSVGQPAPAAQPDAGVEQPTTTSPPFAVALWDAIPWRVVGMLALLVLLLATPRVATAMVRQWRWRRARTPQQRAEAAWDDLRERLADLGVGWAAAWTPRALQLRLAHDHSFGEAPGAALSRLVDDLERARYARPSQLSRPAGERVGDVMAVTRAVASTVEPRGKWLARLFPRSGFAALAGLARRMDAASDQAAQRAHTLGRQVRRTVGSERGRGES